jgi:hypothetical protein
MCCKDDYKEAMAIFILDKQQAAIFNRRALWPFGKPLEH